MKNRGVYHDFLLTIFYPIYRETSRGKPFVLRKTLVWKKVTNDRGCHPFPPEKFCLTILKNFWLNPFEFQKISGLEKNYEQQGNRGGGGGGSNFCEGIFFVSQCRKIALGTLQCFRKLRLSKKFLLNGVVSRFSIEVFQSQSTAKLRRGTLLYFKNFLTGKTMEKCGFSGYSVNNFWSHIQKSFVGKHSCVSENIRYGKNLNRRGV